MSGDVTPILTADQMDRIADDLFRLMLDRFQSEGARPPVAGDYLRTLGFAAHVWLMLHFDAGLLDEAQTIETGEQLAALIVPALRDEIAHRKADQQATHAGGRG